MQTDTTCLTTINFFIQYFARDCTGLEALTAGSQCYSIDDKLPACYDPADLT